MHTIPWMISLPTAGIEIPLFALVLVGFMVGVSSSFLGVGGGFIATPALNILGFPMSHAVGTDLAHMMGKSTVATLKHRMFGNVDFKLGMLMAIGGIPGVELGKRLVLGLDEQGQAGPVIRYVYIMLLTGVAALFLFDYIKSRRRVKSDSAIKGRAMPRWLSRAAIPPFVSLPRSRIARISLWPVILVGFSTGLAAGFLGVGGGFIRMPMLLYLFGVPTLVAIGTDLFEIVISGAYGAFTYSLAGRVDVVAALVMLSGASVGAWLGATATMYVRGSRIKLFFAFIVIAAALATLLKQLGTHRGWEALSPSANYLMIAVAALTAIFITFSLVKGIRHGRQPALPGLNSPAKSAAAGHERT
ncbi:MAG: sulfite exporter TauE/SafE family protein [Chloroflexi bacterium]|nr:sulfite exporter TauE/SafE family protein [Chloroflexota bacterium]